MTYATNAVGISFSQRFTEFSTSIKIRMEKARLYRKMATELQNLSDRNLADLGIHRDAIDAIAIEAAYGK